MSKPTLTPTSQTSTVILTSTGSNATTGNGAGNLAHYPLGLYTDPSSELYDINFINGAADQVAFTYKKLGGDVLDIEITPANVYAAYDESVLEYSYHINMHQAKNMLSDVLGNSTASFDHDGQMTGGDAAGSAHASSSLTPVGWLRGWRKRQVLVAISRNTQPLSRHPQARALTIYRMLFTVPLIITRTMVMANQFLLRVLLGITK